MKEYSAEQLIQKAAAYCAATEHCASEVKEKLIKWGAKREEIEIIVEKLIKGDFINETRYSKMYVKDKFTFNRWGKQKILAALINKRVDRELINSALDIIDEQEYADTLFDLLSKKIKTIKAKSNYELRTKLYQFGMSRGFENREIERAISKIDRDIEEE